MSTLYELYHMSVGLWKKAKTVKHRDVTSSFLFPSRVEQAQMRTVCPAVSTSPSSGVTDHFHPLNNQEFFSLPSSLLLSKTFLNKKTNGTCVFALLASPLSSTPYFAVTPSLNNHNVCRLPVQTQARSERSRP